MCLIYKIYLMSIFLKKFPDYVSKNHFFFECTKCVPNYVLVLLFYLKKNLLFLTEYFEMPFFYEVRYLVINDCF